MLEIGRGLNRSLKNVIDGKCIPFNEFIYVINYDKGIPKLTTTSDINVIENESCICCELYSDGNNYIGVYRIGKYTNTKYLCCNNLSNLVVALRYQFSDYINDELSNYLSDDKEIENSIMDDIVSNYYNFCDSIINEPMVTNLAKNNKSLRKYRNIDIDSIANIINNDGKTHFTGSSYDQRNKFTFNYYCEVNGENAYLVVNASRELKTAKKVVELNIKGERKISEDDLFEISKLPILVGVPESYTRYAKFINEFINNIDYVCNMIQNGVTLMSDNVKLILDRVENNASIHTIGEYRKVINTIIDDNHVNLIAFVLNELPFISKLELCDRVEIITNGKTDVIKFINSKANYKIYV